MNETILLVDDNVTHQYALGKHLAESGFTAIHAQTGQAALEAARTQPVSVVLLDINLPDMTGFEVCRQLRADPSTRSIPVVFHSATHDTSAARANAQSLGAVSFLSYPIDVMHLMSVLRGAIIRANTHQFSAIDK